MNSHAGVTVGCIDLEAAGGHEPKGMSLGCRGYAAQIHRETMKDLGFAELSTLPTAL